MADKSVAEPIDEYQLLSPFWQMIRDIRAGTAAMRDAGRIYLPQMPAEGETTYLNRLKMSVFTNFYKKIVGTLVGKPLKDPVVLEDDVPEAIRDYMDNVDLLGTDLNVFSRNVLESAVDDGVTHILVDFPVTREEIPGAFPDGTLTREQERLLGVRPYAIHIKALDLIGWKYFVDSNGRKVLTQIRYKETVKRPDPESEFLQIFVERVRVYDAASEGVAAQVRIFEKQPKPQGSSQKVEDEWVLIASHPLSLDFIPLVTMYTNRAGFLSGTPWLLDLGYLNIAHWQSDSDQRNIVHVARVPILFSQGLGSDEEGPSSFTLEVGSGTMVKGPKGSDLKYVEHTGAGIAAGRTELQDLEERMQALGASVLVKTATGSETATGDIIDKAEEESELGLVARELESTLENMLDLFAQWLKLGQDSGGSVTVFKDFGISLGADKDLELLQKDRAAGDISRPTYWQAQQRRGVLPDDFDPEKEEELLDAESESLEFEDLESAGGALNRIGDTTGSADGHTHTLQDDGWTNEVNGHRHRWTPEGTVTSTTDDHNHALTRRSEAVAQLETQKDGEESDIDSDDGTQQGPAPAGERGGPPE